MGRREWTLMMADVAALNLSRAAQRHFGSKHDSISVPLPISLFSITSAFELTESVKAAETVS
jgi:hypothetical protein